MSKNKINLIKIGFFVLFFLFTLRSFAMKCDERRRISIINEVECPLVVSIFQAERPEDKLNAVFHELLGRSQLCMNYRRFAYDVGEPSLKETMICADLLQLTIRHWVGNDLLANLTLSYDLVKNMTVMKIVNKIIMDKNSRARSYLGIQLFGQDYQALDEFLF